MGGRKVINMLLVLPITAVMTLAECSASVFFIIHDTDSC